MATNSAKVKFSKKEAVKFGFNLTKKNLKFLIILYVIVILVSGFFSSLRVTTGDSIGASGIFGLLQFIVNLVIGMGIINIGLKLVDGKKAKYKDLFYYKPILNYFLASIAQGFIFVIGFLLLIIPGIIFAVRLQYVNYLIVDKNLGPIEAIKKSWHITRGNTWNLFFFGILLGLINLLGVLALLVGLFVTVPLTLLANTSVYRKLS